MWSITKLIQARLVRIQPLKKIPKLLYKKTKEEKKYNAKILNAKIPPSKKKKKSQEKRKKERNQSGEIGNKSKMTDMTKRQ